MGLKSIAEMLVLSVGEIGRLQLVELGFGDVASIQLVSSSVLSDVDKPDEHGDADSQAEEDDNADFGRSVGRGVFSSERLGSQEVAEAVSDQLFNTGNRMVLWRLFSKIHLLLPPPQ